MLQRTPQRTLRQAEELKQCLKSEIAKAYADGYQYFYCGMAMGFDLLAAEPPFVTMRVEGLAGDSRCAVPWSV